jgi:hypothetical protein
VTVDNNGNDDDDDDDDDGDDDDDDDDDDNNNEVFLFNKIRVGSEGHAYEKCGLTQTRKSTCRNHSE